jgi:hypothetical protein
MENKPYYYSFVCSNQNPSNSLQLVLKGYTYKNLEIYRTPLTVSKSIGETESVERLRKLKEELNKKIDFTPLSPDAIIKVLETTFLENKIIAEKQGYLSDFLDFQLNEYPGSKIDFIEHLLLKKYDRTMPTKVWIEKVSSSKKSTIAGAIKNETETSKLNGLSRIEKLLIITLLQEHNLFITANQTVTQVAIDFLIANLTGISTANDVKKIRLEIVKIRGVKLEPGQITYKLKNLQNIRPIIQSFNNAELLTALDTIANKIENNQSR